MKTLLLIVVMPTLLGWSVVVASAAATYEAVVLNMYGYGLNDAGEISGSTPDGLPVVRDVDGQLHMIESLPDNSALAVYGINSMGHVAGQGIPYAFKWSRTDGMQALPGLSTTKNSAIAINDIGQLAGNSRDESGEQRVVFWATDGTMVPILGLTGWSEAFDINNLGQVVGRDALGAFLWSQADGLCYLAGSGEAVAVNSLGHVLVNQYSVGAYIWRSAGDISFLHVEPSWQSYYARDINDIGQAVGYAAIENTWHTILWNPDGSVVDFGVGRTATGINNHGQVVAGNVLWSPVPEPSSLLALFGGLAGIGGTALRRRK